jgi:hypothetical protein
VYKNNLFADGDVLAAEPDSIQAFTPARPMSSGGGSKLQQQKALAAQVCDRIPLVPLTRLVLEPSAAWCSLLLALQETLAMLIAWQR